MFETLRDDPGVVNQRGMNQQWLYACFCCDLFGFGLGLALGALD